ncbi:DegT/DnrJ/EryC1/StrS family aminotransferase [Mangrovibacterium sp.]|uniref:DegT/DnrJ/EryC1/StrS family aminotransferase n=1 Tax=Mangrovibacterium sp. TaxID=1961364 RepID=UPI0035668EB2
MEFCDLKKQYNAYQSEIDPAIQSVIQKTAFIHGEEIGLLEEELANYVGVKHALTCSSGTDALLLALMALDLQPGEEVICPAFSFIATASMIRLLSGTPVFVDISAVDFNIAVDRIEEKITARTKAILPVSMFGQCADFDPINALAKKYGLWVIEDGAQSFGASYFGKKSCSMTHLATTSFFPAKPLGCYGDGGAIFTNNDDLAEKIRVLRNHGQVARYQHKVIGINGRLDTIQAAVLRVKLKHLDEELAARKKWAQLYQQLLPAELLLPEVCENRESVWAQFTIGLADRDAVRQYLQEKGIPTAVHYPVPLPYQEAFGDLFDPGETFEVSSLLADTVLSLPMHAFLTEEEIRYVAQTITDYFTHEA